MKFHKTVLDNGLRVIVAPQKDNPAVTVLVLVEAGSKYESKKLNGISHFLEHMVFKGTKKRPKAIDISSELDSIGAAYNAFTWYEFTGYWAKVSKQHFDKALDVVSDIYLGQIFDADEIEKERGPITEEINMIEDTPMRKVHLNFINLLYGDQPAGWPIAGPKENIQSIQRDDLIKYKKDHYIASATTVVIAGAVDQEDALGKIEKVFKDIPTGNKGSKLAIKDKQTKPAIYVEKRDSDQTHLALGVRTYDAFDERSFTVSVISDLLGGGMSSRLFDKIRDKMGAAYYVSSRAMDLTDHGFLYANAGVNNKVLPDVVEAILKEFKLLKEELVSDKELQKAKDHIVGSMMLGLETSDSVADFYGDQEIVHQEILKPDQVAEKIQAVTAEEIMAVAKDIFVDDKLNLAVVGPVEDESSLKSLLKID